MLNISTSWWKDQKLIALKSTSAQNREHSTQGRMHTFQGLVRLLCELERCLSGPRTRVMNHDLSLVMQIFIPHVEKLL